MSKPTRRYYRTIFLGVAAMGVLVWSAIEQFNIEPKVMLQLFLVTLLVLGLVIASAAAVFFVWMWLRRFLEKKG